MINKDRFNIIIFIDKIKKLDYLELLKVCEDEVCEAERISSKIPGSVQNRKDGSLLYADKIKKLLFYLRYGKKPHGVDEFEWFNYREIVEVLVKKGEFKSEALNDFLSKDI